MGQQLELVAYANDWLMVRSPDGTVDIVTPGTVSLEREDLLFFLPQEDDPNLTVGQRRFWETFEVCRTIFKRRSSRTYIIKEPEPELVDVGA